MASITVGSTAAVLIQDKGAHKLAIIQNVSTVEVAIAFNNDAVTHAAGVNSGFILKPGEGFHLESVPNALLAGACKIYARAASGSSNEVRVITI